MGLVRDAIVEFRLRAQKQATEEWLAKYGDSPRLHPSTVGHCLRQAMWKSLAGHPDHPLHVEPTHPLDLYVQEVMNSGNVWEEVNAKALLSLGAEHSVRFDTPPWAFELDFLLPGDVPIIIEHKDTSEANFRYKGRLPYEHHCTQLCIYELLMERETGKPHSGILYYNGRGHWAEFQVWSEGSSIIWEGEVDGLLKSGVFDTDVAETVATLEGYWHSQELPPKLSSPFGKRFACLKGGGSRGYWPACQYFSVCWPDMPEDGPIHREDYEG